MYVALAEPFFTVIVNTCDFPSVIVAVFGVIVISAELELASAVTLTEQESSEPLRDFLNDVPELESAPIEEPFTLIEESVTSFGSSAFLIYKK